jgi:5-methylthioadenosine/S-adenosylhomocysteine deaminase
VTTLIENATVVTMNERRDIIRGSILVDGRTIAAVGRVPSRLRRGARSVDAKGLVIIPGFIQTHVHLCQTLFRNLADDLELLDWLKLKIWPFEAAHSSTSAGVSARLGLAELIRCGTTSILDMATVHHTDHIFEAIEESGMRAWCGKAMMDDTPDGPKLLQESAKWSIDESLRLMKTWHGSANGRIQFAFAPRFVLSCTEKLLVDVRDIAAEKKILIHTHASENRSELEAVRQKCGMGNIQYFHHLRMTGRRLCLAHGIWMTDEEMGIVRDTGTNILHCPSSNLKLGSGIAKTPEMIRMGIPVSLGTDGAPCNNNLDMFMEMRLAALIQKPRVGPSALTAKTVFEMATRNGAKTLGADDSIGSIEPGKKADLALLDLHGGHCQPADDVYSQIVYSARSTDVQSVMIDGRWVMRNRELLTLDEQKVQRSVKRELKKLLNRMN